MAEGSGRHFVKEKRNFYNISQGSTFECVPLIELGFRLNLITASQKQELRNDMLAIAKMTTRLIQSIENKL